MYFCMLFAASQAIHTRSKQLDMLQGRIHRNIFQCNHQRVELPFASLRASTCLYNDRMYLLIVLCGISAHAR